MDIKKIISSPMSKKILIGIAICVLALFIFQAGIYIGYHKAAFSYGWDTHYYRLFDADHRQHMMGFPRGKEFSSSYGTIGTIMTVSLPHMIVEDRDGVEKDVTVTNHTIIKQFRQTVRPSDLRVGDGIVVIGEPNDSSQIQATLIRLLPSSATSTPSNPQRRAPAL